jgi:hypothetical protein
MENWILPLVDGTGRRVRRHDSRSRRDDSGTFDDADMKPLETRIPHVMGASAPAAAGLVAGGPLSAYANEARLSCGTVVSTDVRLTADAPGNTAGACTGVVPR